MKGKLRNVVVRIKSTENSHNKTNMDAFTFTATVASRVYHVYKTTSWIKAKVGDKVKVGNNSIVIRNRSVCLCDQNKKQVLL